MMIVWIASAGLVVATVTALLLCRPRASAMNANELLQQLRSVDVDAFQNLIDCREEKYLREHLPARVFRKIHRERMLAAAQYSWHAARNARLLMCFAEVAKAGPDPTPAGIAGTLYAEALDLRVRAIQMSFHLVLRAAMPGRSELPEAFASSYYSASSRFMAFACQRAAVELPRAA